jgi:hypothetical protein
MRVRALAVLVAVAGLAACAAPDGPASPERLGRFAGLVARCGCSDVTLSRMLADYPPTLAGRYSTDDIRRVRGFIEVGGAENFSNQLPICAEVCSQTCAVNAVALPVGGRPTGDGRACTVTEGRLNLTTGWADLD